jgi:hypothetical protein
VMRVINRSIVVVGVLLGALALTGCGTVYMDLFDVRVKKRTHKPEPTAPKHKESYLQFLGKGKNPPRLGYIRLGYELFAPWQVGLRMGGFDPKALQFSLNQQGCIEFDVPNSDPPEYAAFCGFKTSLSGDWSFTVGHNLGGSSGQSPFVNFTGAGDQMELKVEADDLSMIRFYARHLTAIPWTMVHSLDAGSMGYDLTQDSLLPAIGAANLNNKGEVGFASMWGMRATRPSATGEEMVLDSTMDGIRLTVEAIQTLERLVPDQADALDDLNEAKTSYQWSLDYIDMNLPDTKDNGKAVKLLGKAVQFTDDAIDKTQDENWKSARSKSKKAAKSGEKAAGFYFDLDIDF